MDGNKDDAIKCLKIAEAAIQSGDKDRAMKFLNKSRRLDPSVQIDEFLAKINTVPSENTSSNKSADEISKKSTENGVRQRVSGPGSSSSTTSIAYTEEQLTIVKQIKRKKDYYEILGVEKSCTIEDIRKSYRKLSLKVHPDKNSAPGAEEAFKMVSKAFKCLSDKESRNTYDLVGSDEQIAERRANRHGGFNGMNGFYGGGEVDAEEIFRNFFFGGMHNPAATTQFRGFGFGHNVQARRGGGGGGGAGGGGNGMAWLQIIPVLLILLLNFLPSSQPIYSLTRSYEYNNVFTTEKGVNYYVKTRDFEQKYPMNSAERVTLEEHVEQDYYQLLSHNCRLELQQLHWGYRRETPNCDALKQFQNVA